MNQYRRISLPPFSWYKNMPLTNEKGKHLYIIAKRALITSDIFELYSIYYIDSILNKLQNDVCCDYLLTLWNTTCNECPPNCKKRVPIAFS
jgi:hypothetical protein